MSTLASRTELASLKRAAAEAAVELVENDMVVGLGSGSTAAFAIEALAQRHRQGLRFLGIATSEQVAAHATAVDIPLTSFKEHRQIDLTIDGADEVERGTLNLSKRKPASVTDTLRVVRFNNRTPRRSSSCRIEWLSAEGVTSRRDAAARKLR
jgi:hypothetical protein